MMEQQTLLQERILSLNTIQKELIAHLREYASAIEHMQNSCSARPLRMK